MMIKRFLVILLCIAVGAVGAFAQIRKVAEIEAEPVEQDAFYHVFDKGGSRLYFFKKKPHKFRDKKAYWEIREYGEDLSLINQQGYFLPVDQELVGYDAHDSAMFFMFTDDTEYVRDLKLYRLPFDSPQQYQEFNIELPFQLVMSHYESLGHHVILAGQVNDKSVVCLFDLASGQLKVVRNHYHSKNRLLDLTVNEEDKTFKTISVHRERAHKYKASVNVFDEEGQELIRYSFVVPEGQNLMMAKVVELPNLDQLLVASYGDSGSSMLDFSAGVTVARLSASGEHQINMIPFARFEHYFNYLPEKQEVKMKHKQQKKKKARKEMNLFKKMRLSYRAGSDGSHAFFGEFFYPTLKNNTNFSGLQEVIMKEQVYVMTHALMAVFDQEGNFMWDRTFNYENFEMPAITQVGAFAYEQGHSAVMAYHDNNELVSEQIDLTVDSAPSIKERFSSLPQDYKEDHRNFGHLYPWLNKSFYHFGLYYPLGGEKKAHLYLQKYLWVPQELPPLSGP